jgi:alpha-galactosidase
MKNKILFILTTMITASVIMPGFYSCKEDNSAKTGKNPEILTPKPKPSPTINGPLVYGCRPGNPFLYRIPCQGERPIVFSVENLPGGLTLDSASGIISGIISDKGEYNLSIKASNSKGEDSRNMKIIAGDKLALTPPMGYNHWYAHYDRITDPMMREAADILITSGMADVGYEYINIDDCWMNAPKNNDSLRVGPLRDSDGKILPNQHFPDMKGLTDYIHSKGLKAGIYTSPGPLTCGGFAGAYKYEEQDARQFSEWGFDFLKYDWCSYSEVTSEGSPNDKTIPAFSKGREDIIKLKYPYEQMGAILKKQNRDIVFNLCQYGMGEVWKWGGVVGGNCWRTAGDLGFELDRIFDVALKNSEYREYSKPGEWNDPDYIQIGYIGNANKMGIPELTPMPPAMQYAYMSMWCLMASPLIYSGDMTKLDDFTINVLCNREVIEVNQDPLGEAAEVINLDDSVFIMKKTLSDGTLSAGIFNRGKVEVKLNIDLSLLGIQGDVSIRDLWRQTDLGLFNRNFPSTIPGTGVIMVKISPKK